MHLFLFLFQLFLLNYCFTCVVSTNDYFKDEFHHEVIDTCTENFGISDYELKKPIKSAVLSMNISRVYLFMFVNITYTISNKRKPPCFCPTPSLFSFFLTENTYMNAIPSPVERAICGKQVVNEISQICKNIYISRLLFHAENSSNS